MTPKQKRRLIATSLVLGGVIAATVLAAIALSGNVSYLYSPSAVLEKDLAPGARFRLGGVVLEDSVRRLDGLKVRFAVTDRVQQRDVLYEGILPDLFREGQSVIAHGRLGDDGVFVADKVLAKHDETYMPKEVMEAMQRAQQSRDRGPGTGDPGERASDTPGAAGTKASSPGAHDQPAPETDASDPPSPVPGPRSPVPTE